MSFSHDLVEIHKTLPSQRIRVEISQKKFNRTWKCQTIGRSQYFPQRLEFGGCVCLCKSYEKLLTNKNTP